MLQVKSKKTASIGSHDHLKFLIELRIKYISQVGFCIMTAVAALPVKKDDHNGKNFSFWTQEQATERREKAVRNSPGLMQAEKNCN